MSGRLFVCFPRHKLRKLNEFMRKPRNLKKSKRAKKSPKLDLHKTIRSRMSKDDQLVNAKIPEHILNPEPKINCLTDHENERIFRLLSLSHQQLFVSYLPHHVIKRKIKKLARAHARALQIDENKITELWLNEYIEKFKHLLLYNFETELGDNTEKCDGVITNTSPVVQDSTDLNWESHEASVSNHQPDGHVPDLTTLFQDPKQARFSQKRKCISPDLKSVKHIKLDKHSDRQVLAEHTANISTAQSAIKRQLLVQSKQPKNRNIVRAMIHRNKKHFYENNSVHPLLPPYLLHPKRTGCLLLCTNKLQAPKISHKLDDVHDELFELCSFYKEELMDSTSTEKLFEREHKQSSIESDDCDSGYRSRGDSQDSDILTNQKMDQLNPAPHDTEMTAPIEHPILYDPVSNHMNEIPVNKPDVSPIGTQCKCSPNDSTFANSLDISELIECSNTQVDRLNMSPDDIDFMESFFNFDPC